MIDLRSDTVTKPNEEMKQAMFSAELGDDVFEEDPTVVELENRLANMFGMDAGLFCPSGTMTNQIALNIHLDPGDEVICSRESHIYNYEGGGIAKNSGASVRLIEGETGLITSQDVANNINPDDVHYPISKLVALENTCNRGGGICYSMGEMKSIAEVCMKNNLPLHLDGARIFNAIVKNNENPLEYGEVFNSISICLSKGLGAPLGSVLIGDQQFIKKSRRVRKVFGGGMRQVGVVAAAGNYALENNIERLKNDHLHAKMIAQALRKCSWINSILPVETNIVVGYLNEDRDNNEFVELLAKKNIKIIPFGKGRIRMVTHLEINKQTAEKVVEELNF
ncbi:MAG: GntG family PLP-dependent aldolase [Flavobacteriales bacterium]|nr:GntG family PLP-dependent aldolase [Flavobacteriales bacterium]